MFTNNNSRTGATTTTLSTGVSRRTLVVGTVWTVPAVVIATAAPALAASPTQCTYSFNIQPGTCRAAIPGSNSYRGFQLELRATRDPQCSAAAVALFITVTGGGGSATGTLNFSQGASTADGTIFLRTSNQLYAVTLTYAVNGGAASSPVTVNLAEEDHTDCPVPL